MLAFACLCANATAHADGPSSVIAEVQPKMAKIYGAGGFREMEAYQSGFLISDDGYLLTVFSYVLDTDQITVTLNDGQRFDATLIGADPRSEIAVLKINGEGLPHFDLDQAATATPGTPVLAFSNLFGLAYGEEPCSVLHGVIAANSELDAKRGVYQTPYTGPIYVVDAITNNPGAAGGALVNRRGDLLGMLGKELEHAETHTWLNYALPINAIRDTIAQLQEGQFLRNDAADEVKPLEAWSPEQLGIVLVPDVLLRTPPYVDLVRRGSAADAAGVKADDLVVMIGERLVQSQEALTQELASIDVLDPVQLTVVRGTDLLQFEIIASDAQR